MTVWPRELELSRLSPKDDWTLDGACLGTLITGATGSGKTTGRRRFNFLTYAGPGVEILHLGMADSGRSLLNGGIVIA